MTFLRLFVPFILASVQAATPLPIAEVRRAAPIDFEREVLPFLSENCLACHSKTTAKGGLNLETPELMRKGGDSGPAIVPERISESLILQAAAHLDEDLIMPPRGNKAKARDLTPAELGFLKLWIEQGAKASPKIERAIPWQAVTPGGQTIFTVAVTPDGQFAACARGPRLAIYHLPTKTCIAQELADRDQVNALAFSPDGTLLASAGFREVKLWRRVPLAGRAAASCEAIAPASVSVQPWFPEGHAMAARTDEQRFVSANGGNVAKLWDAAGKPIAELRGDRRQREKAEACERALQIATSTVGFRKETIQGAEKQLQTAQARVKKAAEVLVSRRQELETKRHALGEMVAPDEKKLAGAEQALQKAQTALAVAEAEQQLAQAEEQKVTAAIAAAKEALEAAETVRQQTESRLVEARQVATAAEQPIRLLAFSLDKLIVATAGDAGTICTWSAEDGTACEVLESGPIAALAFTTGSELLATDANGSSCAWSLTPVWRPERTISVGFVDRVTALAFSPDGTQLATGGGEPSRGGEIKLWNAITGELARDFPNVHNDAVLGLAFSPDGQTLASAAADRMARLLDLGSGKVARTLEGHTHHVLAIDWSADGRTLATAGADNLVKVWDAATGARKANIAGYEKEVTAVRFAGASATVLTSSGDHRVRLVGLDGKEVRAFPEVTDFMQAVATTADGKIVVAGGQDGVLRVWSGADGRKLAAFPPPPE